MPRLLLAGSMIAALAFLPACTGVLSDAVEARDPGFKRTTGPDAHCLADGVTRPPARVWLLADRQFRNAVQDLLPAVADLPDVRTPGVTDDMFVFESELFKVEASLATQYQLAAQAAAAQAAAAPETTLPCDAAMGTACAELFVARFAPRAFRRPLESSEAAALLDLFELGAADDGFERGIALVIEAVLQSADFLYRRELSDGTGELTSFELAESLSFLFLDSVPDDGLWDAALDGSLVEPAVLAVEVDRLITIPRVRDNLTRVMLDWLGASRVLSARKDPTLFPTFEAPLQESMLEETRLFVHDVLWNRGGDLRELLLSNETFVDARLAAHYGLEGEYGDAHVPATLDPSERAGVLTHASILAGVSDPTTTSIVHRGIFLGRLFLCLPEPVPPPPDLIESVEAETMGLTERELADYRSENATCRGCHFVIDPPGIALEWYDPVGVFRAEHEGRPLDARTTLMVDGQPHVVEGPVELAQRLAESDTVAECVADQMIHYASGRPLGKDLACAQQAVHERFAASGYDIVEVFRSIALSGTFRQRSLESTEAP